MSSVSREGLGKALFRAGLRFVQQLADETARQRAGAGAESSNAHEAQRPSPQAVRPPPDTFPAPTRALTDTLEGGHNGLDDVTIGGYLLMLYAGPHGIGLSVNVQNAPRRIGGLYDIGTLPVGSWFALNDRRGFTLPIAVQYAGAAVVNVRVDPEPRRELATVSAQPDF
jgi:hypothetical protein